LLSPERFFKELNMYNASRLKNMGNWIKGCFRFRLSPFLLLATAAFAGLFTNECSRAWGDELLRAGSNAEFPLRPTLDDKNTSALSPETVIFRAQNLDDRGLNRTVQNIAIPTLTVYRPVHPAHGGAALVVCPGGGYEKVVIDREGYAIARYFEQQGITVAVLKYRLPGQETFAAGLPASQQDALEALRFMRKHAEEWGFAKDRVGIMGFSAGGHLAGSTAIFGDATDGSCPDFVAMLYPVVVMDDPYMHRGSREKLIGPAPSPERIAEFSLERRARAGLPPFFIAHAKNDKLVPVQNSVLLTDALRTADVPAELFLLDTGGHGFSLGRDPDSSSWKDRFIFWLDTLPSSTLSSK
jgi:acetyl esterase/lipase